MVSYFIQESGEGLLDSTEKGVETVVTPLSLSIEENYSRYNI